MNKVILMGRIVHDLELKQTQNGINVCKFRLAVDRNFQKQGEERATDFFNITAWRSTAEFICKYFGKGRMILIEGELQSTQYTDKNGNNSTWYEISAEKAFFTGEKANSNSMQDTLTNANTTQNKGNYGHVQPQTQPQQQQPPFSEEYPF